MSELYIRPTMATRKFGAVTLLGASLLVTLALALCGPGAGSAAAAAAPCFDQLPPYSGIPPWGFHTGPPLTGDRGSYARAYGNIDLDTNRISGKICQVNRVPGREALIVMKALSPIIYHSHYAEMWGYPGNEIKTHVRVLSSDDRACKVGTVGVMTMYASYNGVRSDSVQFHFPAACKAHDHLYHGTEVNAQVPPL